MRNHGAYDRVRRGCAGIFGTRPCRAGATGQGSRVCPGPALGEPRPSWIASCPITPYVWMPRDEYPYQRSFALCSLLGGARAVFGGTLRHERSAEDRRRGESGSHRAAQEPCRHQGRDRLCRPRPQVSDLGAWTLPRGTRGGHREGSRVEEATGLPGTGGRSARSTGMMTSSDSSAVAGGLARHLPVLGRPAVEFLNVHDGGVYIDATFGAGGYSRAILAAASCNVIGIDRDQSAIARGADLVQASGGRLVLAEGKFSNLQTVARGCG